MDLCPSWKFIIENEQTWRKVRQHYLSEFRCIDSSMLTRLNVLSFAELLDEQMRLHTKEEVVSPSLRLGSTLEYVAFLDLVND